jgi:desulfoferrodoxin-like iron-binding protein
VYCPAEHWLQRQSGTTFPVSVDCHLLPEHWIRRKLMVNVSKEGQVFKCEICGNVVVIKEAGGGELICCGEPMQLESA